MVFLNNQILMDSDADLPQRVVVEAVHYRAGVGEDDLRATVNVRDDVECVRSSS